MGDPRLHFELSVDDVNAAKRFDKSVFDGKVEDLGPSMGGQTIDFGQKGSGGGIEQKTMNEQPAGWLTSVRVAGVKATMAKAVKAGAKALAPFEDSGSMGVIGFFVDPQGATVGLGEKAKSAPTTTRKKKTKS